MLLSDRIKIYPRRLLSDNRGWFLKAITGTEDGIQSSVGEVYFTSAKPGEAKGNHYHDIAQEWFTLICGKASLILEDITTMERLVIELDSASPQTVYIPPKVAHAVVNNHDTDFILCAYTDRQYDPSDTIPYTL